MYKLSYIKFEEVDFDSYHKIVNSDNVMKYITGSASTLERSTERFKSIMETNESHHLGGYFKVYDRNQMIGLAKLENYIHEEDTIEVGYILMEDFWGMGYGTTICQDLVSFARQHELAKFIIGIIDPENIASKKILMNAGLESYFIGEENNLPTEKLRLKL